MAISDSSISDITTSYLKAWEQLGLKTGDYNGDGGTQQSEKIFVLISVYLLMVIML